MADNIQKLLNTVRNKIFGTTVSSKIIRNIDDVDKSLDRIVSDMINKDSVNYADLIRSIFGGTISSASLDSIAGSQLFQNPEVIDRLIRYANAEEICDNIPYCDKALRVLSSEIVSADDITKEVIQIFHPSVPTDHDREVYDRVKVIIESIGLEDHIHDIVQDTLKLGDQFIEVCDFRSRDVPIMQTILQEQYGDNIPENELQGRLIEVEIPDINELSKRPVSTIDHPSNGNGSSSSLNENITRTIKVRPQIVQFEIEEEDQNKKPKNPRDIRLIIHDPRFVVKIQSRRFRFCLGYLVFPQPSYVPFGTSSFISRNSYTQSGYFHTKPLPFQYHHGTMFHHVNGIDRVYEEIIGILRRYIGTKKLDDDIDEQANKKEIMDIINRIIIEYSKEVNELKIRYVPPERMEHFYINNKRFFPYGESIFHRTVFNAKLLIALETALVIKRITDSTDKRVVYIETGLTRSARKLIEEFKEKMNKIRFSLDSAGSIGSIPSMITTYETYYVPQVRGQRVVEFDTLSSNLSIRDIADELKFFRDMLVGALDVPPSYINLEENLSNKAALSHENIIFARTVVSYQQRLTKHLRGLVSKVYRMLHEEALPSTITITFSPPRMLQLERESEHMDMASRIIGTLKELGIPEEYLKRKYLPINWDEIKDFETKANLDKLAQKGGEGEEEGGGGMYGY